MARPTTYVGSLDPFQDIAEKLDELGVAYCLIIQMEGQPALHSWSNIRNFDSDIHENFVRAVEHAAEGAEEDE